MTDGRVSVVSSKLLMFNRVAKVITIVMMPKIDDNNFQGGQPDPYQTVTRLGAEEWIQCLSILSPLQNWRSHQTSGGEFFFTPIKIKFYKIN